MNDGRSQPQRRQKHIFIGWSAVTVFVLTAAILVDYRQSVRVFQAGWLIGFAGYALLVRALHRLPADRVPGSPRNWLIGFVLLRLLLLHTVPSDDLYRYAWEGKIQRHGFNPYRIAPNDPALTELAGDDHNWKQINHKDYPAIYPPLAQLLFRAVSSLSNSVYAFKFILVALEIVCIILLGRWLQRQGLSPYLTAVYALNPLSLTAFGIEGHVDSLMLLWLALAALAAVQHKPYHLGVYVGLAIASKLVAVVLLVWLAFKKRRAALSAVLIAGMSYLLYADAGWDLFASLNRFVGQTSILGPINAGLEALMGAAWSRRLCAVVLLAFLIRLAVSTASFQTYGRRAMIALIALVPVVHFWYLTWFLLLCCARTRVWHIVLTGGMVFYFEAPHALVEEGRWRMPEWAPLAIYTPAVMVLLAETLLPILRRRTAL